ATATPCGNDIWGLYNLMFLINPKVLGTKEDFKKNFLVTQLKKVKRFNPIIRRYEFPLEEIIIGYKNIELLHERIKNYIIIRQKKYNLEFIYHKCTLTPEETDSYMKASAGLARGTSRKNW